MKKTIFFSFLLLFIALAVGARELKVESFEAVPTDITARTNAVNDLNGNKCALIKVSLPVAGCDFKGNVLKQEFQVNEYYVYMSGGTKDLQVRCPGVESLMVDFRPFTEGRGLESGMTYYLRLSGYEEPSTGNTSPQNNINGNYLILDIIPKSGVVVEVDGNVQNVNNGQTSVFLDFGNHDITVKAAGYATYTGTVTIGSDGKTTKSIQLESIQAKLNVNSATPGVTIKINGNASGNGTFSGMVAPGKYLIEVEKAGHRPYSTSVELRQKENRTVDIPFLQPIYTNLDVSYTPIGATIAIDGKNVGTTPDIIRNVLVGSHTITISKEGYETATLNANLTEGQPSKLTGELKERVVNIPSDSDFKHTATPPAPTAEPFQTPNVNPPETPPITPPTPTAETKINGHEAVDLGLSVKWATCNVGASKPSDYGNYYAWGETKTKSKYLKSNSVTYGKSMKDIGGTKYDVAHKEWGGSWRMPTEEEFQELIEKCKWQWTTIDGHAGCKVTGPNGKSIFLPATGYRNDDSGDSAAGSQGDYWSSTPYYEPKNTSKELRINSFGHYTIMTFRNFGFSIRPVIE